MADLTTERLDPDALAALEEQRDFLRRSLADLDREREAGDVDDVDYATLRADYERRAAAVDRAITEGRARFAAARRRRSPVRTIAVAAAALVFAAVVGLVVAQAVGRREPGQPLAGGVGGESTSTRDELARCLDLGSRRRVLDALQCYDAVLEREPDNVEAMAYRGWLLHLAGLPYEALPWLDRAVEVDARYPDVRVFRAAVLRLLCQPDDAQADLDALDGLAAEGAGTPPFAEFTVGLREAVAADLAGAGEPCTPPPPTPTTTP
jgi:tetratricopeptide (TPR) repeat protein